MLRVVSSPVIARTRRAMRVGRVSTSRPPSAARGLVSAQEHSQPGGAEKLQARQVQNDLVVAVAAQPVEELVQASSGAQVQLTAQHHTAGGSVGENRDIATRQLAASGPIA